VSNVIVIAAPPFGMSRLATAAQAFWESNASEERKQRLKQNWEKLTPDMLRNMAPGEALIRTYVTSGPGYWYDPTYDCSWLWEGVEPNMEVTNHLFGVLFKDYDIAQGPGEITMPVFLALGRYDYVVPYATWDDRKGKLPNLTSALFENSGHTPQLEEATLFNQKLTDWIENDA
jgi:proline iminopeptidase